MIATFYLSATGQITRVIDAPAVAIPAQVDSGEAWIEGDWLRGWRIDPETKQPVALMQFAVVVSANRITAIPAGTVVRTGGDAPEVCDDGEVDFVVTYPTTITVHLAHPHYEPATVEVTCEV